MKIVVSAVIALLLASAANAADRQRIEGTTLDACDLQGHGLAIASANACVRITGGVSYTQSWGNYKTDDYGDPLNGQKLVTTPGGVFTIPAPNN